MRRFDAVARGEVGDGPRDLSECGHVRVRLLSRSMALLSSLRGDDCSVAPAMVAVIVAHCVSRFQIVDEIHIRIPKPPLDYQLVFAVEGLLNECVEPARVIRNGEIRIVPSMAEVDTPLFERMEAFQASGATSTIPGTARSSRRCWISDWPAATPSPSTA